MLPLRSSSFSLCAHAAMMAVLALCCLSSVGVRAADTVCSAIAGRNAPPAQAKFSGGAYRVCVGSGSPGRSLKLEFCTKEKLNIPAGTANKFLLCSRGNVKNRKAWLTSYQGAAVIVTNEADDLTSTVAKAQFASKVTCDGFYTALALNPDTPNTKVEHMFQQLTNCHIADSLKAQAQGRVTTAIGLVSDLIGAIPHPAAVVTGLVIKACLTGVNLDKDMTEDDRLKFLAVHFTIAKLRVQCGSVDGPAVKKCLAKANTPLAGGASKYKIEFNGCKGSAGSDDYLELHSNGAKVLTTGLGTRFVGSSPLAKLCEKGTAFQYIDMKFDATKKFCVKCWGRRTGRANILHGEKCLNNAKLSTQTITVKCSKQITLTFTTMKQG